MGSISYSAFVRKDYSRAILSQLSKEVLSALVDRMTPETELEPILMVLILHLMPDPGV